MNRKHGSLILSALSTLGFTNFAWADSMPVYSPDVPFLVEQVKPTVINGVLVVGHQEPVWVNPDSVPFHRPVAEKPKESADEKLNALAEAVSAKSLRAEQEKALGELQAANTKKPELEKNIEIPPASAQVQLPSKVSSVQPVTRATPGQQIPSSSKPLTVQPNAPAPAPITYTFVAEGGEMLSRMLSRNLKQYGWDLAWRASADFNVFKEFKIEGTSVPEAVAQIGKIYGITPEIYSNHVVLINDPDQRMPTSFVGSKAQ